MIIDPLPLQVGYERTYDRRWEHSDHYLYEGRPRGSIDYNANDEITLLVLPPLPRPDILMDLEKLIKIRQGVWIGQARKLEWNKIVSTARAKNFKI